MKHYGDIKELKGKDLEPVDVVCGGSPCFVSGTLVYTMGGFMSIEDVKVGYMVLTHTNHWHKVTETMCHFSDDIYKIDIVDAKQPTYATGNHPYLVSHVEWVKCGEITDYVRSEPRWIEVSKIKTAPKAYPLVAYPHKVFDKINGDWHTAETYYHIPVMWRGIRSIEKTDRKELVYNLEVEEDHSYTANGVIVHNCQDLSISGRRKGFEGERSSLFLEQIRLIKELRERDRTNGLSDELIRPRYMLWENVCGSLSSRGGQDFARVIEETVKIAEPKAPSVQVPKNGWSKCGCFYDELGRWSIAWRVHDSQFWGVPQRRKRVALVADFGGLSASEILFERKGLQWNSEKVCSEEQAIATDTGTDAQSTGDSVGRDFTAITLENHMQDGRVKIQGDGSIVQTLTQQMGTGGNNVPLVLEKHTFSQQSFTEYAENDTAVTLRASGGCYGGGSEVLVCDKAIRKLTPLECERLQGFPDNWTNIEGASDTARYKALGNSIALPYWKVLVRRIAAQYDRDITVGSLFDGLGGFPLAFQHCGGKTLWVSEIEPFPTAVTKYHFGEE